VAESGVTYTLNQPRFAFRHWDDGCVAHDEADGSLYELTPAAGLVLTELQAMGGQADGMALASKVLQAQPEHDDIQLIQELMVQLGELGIVRLEPA